MCIHDQTTQPGMIALRVQHQTCMEGHIIHPKTTDHLIVPTTAFPGENNTGTTHSPIQTHANTHTAMHGPRHAGPSRDQKEAGEAHESRSLKVGRASTSKWGRPSCFPPEPTNAVITITWPHARLPVQIGERVRRDMEGRLTLRSMTLPWRPREQQRRSWTCMTAQWPRPHRGPRGRRT